MAEPIFVFTIYITHTRPINQCYIPIYKIVYSQKFIQPYCPHELTLSCSCNSSRCISTEMLTNSILKISQQDQTLNSPFVFKTHLIQTVLLTKGSLEYNKSIRKSTPFISQQQQIFSSKFLGSAMGPWQISSTCILFLYSILSEAILSFISQFDILWARC